MIFFFFHMIFYKKLSLLLLVNSALAYLLRSKHLLNWFSQPVSQNPLDTCMFMDKRKVLFFFFKGVKFSLADHIHKCHLLDYNLKFHLDLLPVKKCSFNLCQGEVWTENWNGANQLPWRRGRETVSKLLGGKSTTFLPEGNTPTFTSLKGTPINFPSGTP